MPEPVSSRSPNETTDTTADSFVRPNETTITNARPQTATIETTITSTTEKRPQNAHFSPAKAMAVSTGAQPVRAKAMAVSIGARPARTKAIAVSRERFQMPVGGGGARAKQKSHIISHGNFLSLSTNVAIATMRIQSLK